MITNLYALVMFYYCTGNVALVSLLIYKSFKSMNIPWLHRMIQFILNHDSHGLCYSNFTRNTTADDSIAEEDDQLLPEYLQFCKSYGMKDWLAYAVYGAVSSFLMYHVVCGYLQWQYYYKQRHQPHNWKCQPKKFLTASNERHEILVGTMNILYGGSISGTVSCWIANGNYSTVYFQPGEYGYLYFIFSIPAVFLYIEAAAYYYHRMVHIPFLYKHLHKHHHRYHSPTAYAAVAMSPIEITCFITCFIVPLFTIPVNAWVFVGNLMYINYYGMLDHSGIKLTSWFPWQPDSIYHDDHHR